MACVQQVRTSQDTQLLPNQVLSEQQSMVVMKRLLAIAVSGITYLRGIFPEKAYGSRYVEDQKVMILKEERSCPGANQIVKWMQGCFEAIQYKYLRTVIMSGIYSDQRTHRNPPKVTEYYQFRIQYTTKGAQMDFESSNNDNKVSSMSCGNTKKDYQPPGFKDADGDNMEFEKEPIQLTMGEVLTPYHTLKLDMATERQRLEQVEESVNVTEKWILNMEEEGDLSQTHVIEDVEKPDDSIDLDNRVNPPYSSLQLPYTLLEIEMSCHEKIKSCEEVMEMVALVKKTSDMEMGMKRTRSGRIIRSTT
ncbi:HORMA domain containing protein 1, partial [Dissostichus eleginoides]